MMNLSELRKLVAFMKENGLCELEYSEKHTSVKLRLAPPPPPPPFGHRGPRPRPMHKDEPVEAEYDLTDEEDLDVDFEDLKASARRAARKAAHKAADGMENVASYVKSKLAEDEEGDEDESTQAPSDETAGEPDQGEDASHTSRETLRHAGEAVRNTVRAGAVLGRAGAKRGKERLVNLFRSNTSETEEGSDDFAFSVDEDEEKE